MWSASCVFIWEVRRQFERMIMRIVHCVYNTPPITNHSRSLLLDQSSKMQTPIDIVEKLIIYEWNMFKFCMRSLVFCSCASWLDVRVYIGLRVSPLSQPTLRVKIYRTYSFRVKLRAKCSDNLNTTRAERARRFNSLRKINATRRVYLSKNSEDSQRV